jgi:hypothetical protein
MYRSRAVTLAFSGDDADESLPRRVQLTEGAGAGPGGRGRDGPGTESLDGQAGTPYRRNLRIGVS